MAQFHWTQYFAFKDRIFGLSLVVGDAFTNNLLFRAYYSAQSEKFGHIERTSPAVVNAQAHPKAKIDIVENVGGL